VHATKFVAAVLDVETGELGFCSMAADIAGVAGFCAGLPGPVRAANEAGSSPWSDYTRATPMVGRIDGRQWGESMAISGEK